MYLQGNYVEYLVKDIEKNNIVFIKVLSRFKPDIFVIFCFCALPASSFEVKQYVKNFLNFMGNWFQINIVRRSRSLLHFMLFRAAIKKVVKTRPKKMIEKTARKIRTTSLVVLGTSCRRKAPVGRQLLSPVHLQLEKIHLVCSFKLNQAVGFTVSLRFWRHARVCTKG